MRMDDLVHFCAPARLIIAAGARAQLPPLMQRLGYRHGVLVTDTFFTGHTPWVREYVDAAARLGITTLVYDGGLPDPTTTLCDAATAEVRSRLAGTVPDHVIALGGAVPDAAGRRTGQIVRRGAARWLSPLAADCRADDGRYRIRGDAGRDSA